MKTHSIPILHIMHRPKIMTTRDLKKIKRDSEILEMLNMNGAIDYVLIRDGVTYKRMSKKDKKFIRCREEDAQHFINEHIEY